MRQRPVILCVDDQKEILDSLEDQILLRLGDEFDCELAESGEEALELMEDLTTEEGSKVAVIVSDQLMPGMKGDEFLIKAHDISSETIKILLTGQASIQAVRNVINQARLYRYVEKPWDEKDLMLTIEEAAKSYMQYLQLIEYNRMLRLLNVATQELSSEINVESLFKKFMTTAMKSSEAERGFLIVKGDEGMNVQAVASIIKDEAKKLELKQVNENPELTVEVLEKVEHHLSKKPTPAYQVASPIYNSGKNIGYVYLENPMTRASFNDIQREILQMLASQAAISIENANLYQSTNKRTIELQAEKEKLAEVNLIIEQKNKDITDSIRYARRIQESVLPETELLKSVFPDSFCLYHPKEIVSGDFYWWMDMGETFLFAAVDCTGDGVPGAFMSVMASSFLNQIATEYLLTDPEVILDFLNTRVISTLRSEEEANVITDDGLDIAMCAYQKSEMCLHFSGANRNFWLIRNGQLIEYKGISVFVGSSEDTIHPGEKINLQKGDRGFVFTDGLCLQTDLEGNPIFTESDFQNLLLSSANLSLAEIENRLSEEILNRRGDLPQTDDILIIGFEI